MVQKSQRIRMDVFLKRYMIILIGTVWSIVTGAGMCLAAPVDPQGFGSPEDATKALVSALESRDKMAVQTIFGPGSEDIVSSGDPVADEGVRERFIHLYREKHFLDKKSDEEVFLHIGKEDWPFPVPIVKKASLWQFDAHEGREEILARRIGRNELSAIQVCLAYVDAQREYALKDRDGDGILAYAHRIKSEPGKKDGLYWEAGEGMEQSPMGALMARAQEEGYSGNNQGRGPSPYHGYYYRILAGQGKDAAGGAYDYLVKGKMIGGFALVAYPAQYGASGIMTFVVNHDGTVYQKDLGEGTTKEALAMTLFNPDSTWRKAAQWNTRAKK